jgi:hypothetical protein
MIVTTPHIDPWTHPAFSPLPDIVLRALNAVNAIEMPTRHAFDEVLNRFVAGLTPELRETATFVPEIYAEIARAVSEGLVGELPTRLRIWASCHHARAGSRKHHLVLVPRDAFYNMNAADEEKLRANYIVRTDGGGGASGGNAKMEEGGASSLESQAVFERVPVHNQIYDILVYTHRNHGSPSTMLFEARRMGIVRTLAVLRTSSFVDSGWLVRRTSPGPWLRCLFGSVLCARCEPRTRHRRHDLAAAPQVVPKRTTQVRQGIDKSNDETFWPHILSCSCALA